MALLAVLCLATSAAQAEEAGDIGKLFKVNDADPVGSIPTPEQRDKHPIEFAQYLQDVIARAEHALEARDYAKAVKYHEALARMIPDRAISFSRLCVDYGRLGRPDEAAANCARAIQLGGAKVIDHIRFVNFALQKKEFTPETVKDIEASLTHLREYAVKNPQPVPGFAPKKPAKPAGTTAAAASAEPKPKRSKEEAIREFAERRQERLLKEAAEKKAGADAKLNPMHLPTEIETLTCKLASRLRDANRLGQCLMALRRYKATDAQLYPFEWARAVILKDSRRAEQLLERGKKLGIPEATLAAMADEQKTAIGGLSPQARWALGGVGLLLAAIAFVAGGRWLSRRRRTSSGPVEA